MATISTSGISAGQIIRAEHLLRVINALDGTSPNNIVITAPTTISGSLALTGSLSVSGSAIVRGLTTTAQTNVVTYNASTGQFFYTASNALALTGSGGGGAGGSDTQIQFNSGSNLGGNSAFRFIYNSSSVLLGTGLSSGLYALAQGINVTASANFSTAIGSSTKATNLGAHAEGTNTLASGQYSHAEGRQVSSSGNYSHAEGYLTNASGEHSHAEGRLNQALGNSSHAEGYFTSASGNYSHTEGIYTIASGEASHAEGDTTLALGNYSHAEGLGTITSGSYQHVQGAYNISSSAQSAFIIGNGTDTNNRSNLVFASGSQFQVTGSIQSTGQIAASSLNINNTASLFMYSGGTILTTAANTGLSIGGGPGFVSNSLYIPQGTVGIGKNYPAASSAALDVLGNVNITGSLRVSGSITGSFTGSFRGDGSQLTGISQSLLQNIVSPVDAYYGTRLQPITTNSGFFVSNSLDTNTGYFVKNSNAGGTGAIAAFTAQGSGSAFTNAVQLAFFGNSYFVSKLRTNAALYSTNNLYIISGKNTSSTIFTLGNTATPSVTNTDDVLILSSSREITVPSLTTTIIDNETTGKSLITKEWYNYKLGTNQNYSGSLFGTSSYTATSSITTAISGSTGYIPVFTGVRTQANSPIYASGGRVAIGTESPNAVAILQLDTTSSGFLPPRMTTTDMNNITSPPKGLMIYNTTLDKIAVYNGNWKYLAYD